MDTWPRAHRGEQSVGDTFPEMTPTPGREGVCVFAENWVLKQSHSGHKKG